MKKFLIMVLPVLMGIQLSAQDNIDLVESSIRLSKSELLTALTKKLGGAKPEKLNKPDQTVYHVPASGAYADMYIYKDTCMEIQITYANVAAYNKDAALIKAYGEHVQGDRTFYYKPGDGKIIYYSVDPAKLLIVAVDKHFYSGLSYKD